MATEVNLVLGADTTQVDKGASSLDQLTGAAKKTASELAALARAEEKMWEAGTKLVLKLEDLVATFGMTTEQIYSYRAAQLGVVEETQVLIAELTNLKRTQQEASIQQTRDLELYRMRSAASAQLAKDVTDEANAYFAAMNRQIEIEQRRDYEIYQMRAKASAEAIALRDKEAAAYFAAVNKEIEIEQRRDTQLYEMRQKAQAAAIALRDKEATAYFAEVNAEIAAAEKRAIEEIKWNELSVKTRIAQLEKLKLYQANSAISPATITSTFGSAAINDLPNLTRYQNEYQAALAATATAHAAVKNSAEGASKAVGETGVQMARATTEAAVLAREFSRGNYSRMTGSFTIFAQALGLGISPLTMLAAGVGLLAYEMGKGALEEEKMNGALVMTGNYAGMTAASLDALAHSAAGANGSISSAKEAVTALAGSGKFTAEEIGKITESAVLMEHATGQSVATTIKQFETLAVQMQGGSVKAADAVSKSALKLDDTYHFLTESIFEQIRAFERDGESKKASELALNKLAEVTKERSQEMMEQAGNVAKAWHAVAHAIGAAIDSLMSWGKNNPTETIGKLKADIAVSTDKISRGDVSRTTTLKLDDDLNKLEIAQAHLTAAQLKATEASQKARMESEATHAADRISDFDAKHKKDNIDGYTQAVKAYKTELEAIRRSNPDSALLSDAAVQQHMASLKKEYTTKGRTQGSGKADAYQKASLEDVVKPMQVAITAEAKTLADTQKLLDAQYAQGDVSLKDYLKGEQDARDKAYAATVDSYDREIAATRNYIANVKDATRKLNGEALLKTEIAKKEQYVKDMTSKENLGDEKDQKIVQAYKDSLAKLSIQVDTLKGNLLDAATAQELLSNRQERKTLTINAASGDAEAQAGLENLNKREQYKIAQAGIAQQTQDYNLLLEQQNTLEGEIALKQLQGSMSEMEGLVAVRDLRKKQIDDLQTIAENYRKIADALDDPKIKADAAAFKLKIDQTAASADVLAIRMNGLVQGPLETFFSSAMSGTTSVSQAFANMGNSILKVLNDIIAKQIVAGFMGTGAGGSGGFGGIIGDIVGFSTPATAGNSIYATGGFVSGPGSGTSDSIKAMLSNGEFVINADATARNRDLLEAINKGGSVAPRKFADGGYVGSTTLPDKNPLGSNISIQIVNEGSQQQQVKSATPIFDINGMVVKIVLTDLQKGGPIRSAVQNLPKP